jgi:hypothetical protein
MGEIVIKAGDTSALTLEMIGDEEAIQEDENEKVSGNRWDLYVVVFIVILFILGLFGYLWLKKRGKND